DRAPFAVMCARCRQLNGNDVVRTLLPHRTATRSRDGCAMRTLLILATLAAFTATVCVTVIRVLYRCTVHVLEHHGYSPHDRAGMRDGMPRNLQGGRELPLCEGRGRGGGLPASARRGPLRGRRRGREHAMHLIRATGLLTVLLAGCTDPCEFRSRCDGDTVEI